MFNVNNKDTRATSLKSTSSQIFLVFLLLTLTIKFLLGTVKQFWNLYHPCCCKDIMITSHNTIFTANFMHRLPSRDAQVKTDEFKSYFNWHVSNISAARIGKGKFSIFLNRIMNLPQHQLDLASYLAFLVLRNQLAERNQPERKSNLLTVMT